MDVQDRQRLAALVEDLVKTSEADTTGVEKR